MNKCITLAQSESAVRAARRAGLFTSGYFILGYPGETSETIRETVAFAERLPLDSVLYSHATAYPGSAFRKAIGPLSQTEWDSLNQWRPTYAPDGMTPDQLAAYAADATRSFYMRPRIWSRHAARAVREGLVMPYLREGLGFLRYAAGRSMPPRTLVNCSK